MSLLLFKTYLLFLCSDAGLCLSRARHMAAVALNHFLIWLEHYITRERAFIISCAGMLSGLAA